MVYLRIFLVVLFFTSCNVERPGPFIGYTEMQTNLPGGRQVNINTMQAVMTGIDGQGHQLLAREWTMEPNTYTQFAGWSPDGNTAIINKGWKSPENALWEENFTLPPQTLT